MSLYLVAERGVSVRYQKDLRVTEKRQLTQETDVTCRFRACALFRFDTELVSDKFCNTSFHDRTQFFCI
jgi:hypothetical protein